jgi:hypothetical protein
MALDPMFASRLIQNGAMDGPDDNYPRVCESCDREFPGDADKALASGWKLSPDGWLCKFCLD